MTWPGFVILAFSLVAGCSNDSSKKNKGSSPPPVDATPPESADSTGTDENTASQPPSGAGSVEESDPERLAMPGSRLRFPDGHALTRVYRRVFTPASFGFQHCRRRLPSDNSLCQSTIFTSEENAVLGSFGLNHPNGRFGFANIRPVEDLTLNYVRFLRVMLERECRALVDREWTNARNGAMQDPVLIRRTGAPLEADLDEFMRRLLGIHGTGIKADTGAGQYHSAFQQVLAAAAAEGRRQEETALRDGWLNICIAMAMDPRIITY